MTDTGDNANREAGHATDFGICHIDPRADLCIASQYQRRILWVALAYALCTGSLFALADSSLARIDLVEVLAPIQLILHFILALGVVRLARAIGYGLATCLLVLAMMLIPFINIAVVAAISMETIRLLRQAGIRAGMFGSKYREVLLQVKAMQCLKCDYNLTGNTSGRCPECGTQIPADQLEVMQLRMHGSEHIAH